MKFGTLGHVEEVGVGPDLVLIPGASFDWSVWRPFMQRNEARYHMLAVSPPGNGGTRPYPYIEQHDFEALPWTRSFVDAVAKLIADRGLRRPIVLTHHMLADHYGMRLALEHPDLVGGLVMMASSPAYVLPDVPTTPAASLEIPRSEQLRIMNKRWLPFFRTVDKETWQANDFSAKAFSADPARGVAMEQAMMRTPIPTQLGYYVEYLTTNFSTRLRELQPPILLIEPKPDLGVALQPFVVAGNRLHPDDPAAASKWVDTYLGGMYGSPEAAREALVTSETWEAVKDRVPNLELVYVEDARIFVMEDQPERVDAMVAEFVERTEL